MLNPVLMLLARDRYVSDGCEEAMAQGLAESYAQRFGYCYPMGYVQAGLKCGTGRLEGIRLTAICGGD
jgi:hypothetical protein